MFDIGLPYVFAPLDASVKNLLQKPVRDKMDLLMDYVWLLVLMQAVLTVYAEENTTSNVTTFTASPSISPTLPMVKTTPNIVKLPTAFGRIKVEWFKENPCQGTIKLTMHFNKSIMHLCGNDHIVKTELGNELCEERRCGDLIGFKYSETKNGYVIHQNLTVTTDTKCSKVFLTCKDKDSKELVTYKVITGLLLTLIIGVLLSRFAQPTYIAFRKRLSYHRGQASNPNNNTMKRTSYPGLERLTVNPSREPSSNRNSDYDSYGN
ncbi:T-cell surface glycoprotein CD5 isoform X2 [Silurus asotus]|uniref:T-cell surface glycoprotein CD5 isoform X2 n=1 Tax=Silurus asotus TaxID=30991 RepID=A0AAD5AJL2_SILAS|nr:T-cell surface glycoprotein CD5 isoform X2 [Silurus asotus]